MTESMATRKLSIRDLQTMKEQGEPISVATAYDYVTVRLLEEAGIDIIVPSDWGIATTLLGQPTSVQAKMDDVLFYLTAVARLVRHGFVLATMPYGSYEVSNEQVIHNATLFLKAGADAVTVQGAGIIADRIHAMSEVGVICVAHLGFTPHRIHQLGGMRPVGVTAAEAVQLVRDAKLLEQAGAWALILDSVPSRVAHVIAKKANMITIGSGGTQGCDGQMMMTHSVLGLPETAPPLFAHAYAHFDERGQVALNRWCTEVRSGEFPTERQTFKIADDQFARFVSMIG